MRPKCINAYTVLRPSKESKRASKKDPMTVSGRRCINRLQLLASIPLKFMRFKSRLFYPSGIQYSVHTYSPCLIIHTRTPIHWIERRAISARFPDWRHSGTRRQEKRQQPLFRAVRGELPFPTLKHASPLTWLSLMKPRICKTFYLYFFLVLVGSFPRRALSKAKNSPGELLPTDSCLFTAAWYQNGQK